MWWSLLKRIWANLGTFLLAFALAFAVWISAVVAADPSEERDYPSLLPLEARGMDAGLLLIGNLPTTVTARISAPASLWGQLSSNPGSLHAYIDLTGLAAGEFTVPIRIESSLRPIRIVQVIPQEASIALEPKEVRELPVSLQTEGHPALGFQVTETVLNPMMATVVGPRSLIEQVATLQAVVNLTNERESITPSVDIKAVDVAGNVLSGLTIDPAQAHVTVTIQQAGGYRDVAVKVETIGQPSSGYRVTNISVSPQIVTLFSTDPQLVASLPGYVGTQPLDLTNLKENLQTHLALALPAGVIVVGEEQNVQVLIGIAPIETSISLNLNVEVVGLANGYEARLSPLTVTVILSGPLSVLQNLHAGDVRLLVDVSGLLSGTYLLEPKPEIVPTDVRLLSITPSSVQVTIQKTN